MSFIKSVISKVRRFLFGDPVWSSLGSTPIIHAFNFDGVDYFTFSNVYSMPYQRAFSALTVYEEVQMRITKEYLQEWVEAMKDQINSTEIKLTNLMDLINLLDERVNWSIDVDSYLKLASVIYFTREENPTVYDVSYNRAKIEKWKESKDVLSFFLQRQLKELMPLSEMSPEAIQTYMVGSLSRNVEMLAHLQRLSRTKRISESRESWLNYQIQSSRRLISKLLQFSNTASSSDTSTKSQKT